MKNNRGQGLIEYLILVCLIAVTAIGVVSTVGQNIREQYRAISLSLQGSKERVKLTQPDEKSYQHRGLDDFMESAGR